MNYIQEVEKILREVLFKEEWMDEDDYTECVEMTLSLANITREQLAQALEKGVSNGHSIETQTALIKKIFGK